MKSALVMRGNDFGERGLAGARRAPEDHRGRVVTLDLHAQRFAGADQMLLPDKFIERARAHAVGERASARGVRVFGRDGSEEVVSWGRIEIKVQELQFEGKIGTSKSIKNDAT